MADAAARWYTDKDRYPTRGLKTGLQARQEPVVHGTPDNGPLAAEQLAAYAQQGFLTFSSLFNPDELESWQTELARLRSDTQTLEQESAITEPGSGELRSIFAVHKTNAILKKLCRDARLVAIARQLLGSDVYIHQSRINYKPGFKGKEFYWHSDFETWHAEDGMPAMRAVSCSISLTENTAYNGPLLVIPGSHCRFLACAGETPENHYKQSLKKQEYGVPDDASLTELVADGGITATTGPAGSVTFFECNLMHGSNSNITPLPRSNVFIVFNSVHNIPQAPFCGRPPRPWFIAEREAFDPLQPASQAD